MVPRRIALIFALVVGVGLVFLIARPDDEDRFLRAVREGDVKTVAALLEGRPELLRVEESHKGGSTPVLYLALSAGHNEIVKLLLERGVVAEEYPHALLLARNVEVARLLIQHGADVDRQGKYGDAPLHLFAAIGDTAMMEFLFDHGADVEVRGQQDETPLHKAAREGSLEAVRLLIAEGADIHATSKRGKTPLDYAVLPVWDEDAQGMDLDRIRRCREVGSYLLSRGSRHTVFDLAWLGDVERLAGALAVDPSLANAQAHGESLLFSAIRGGDANLVNCLLEHGGRLDVVGRHQQTPLQVAAYTGHAAVADVLLRHGAAIDERGPWGESALHWAAFRGHAEVAALLLDRGADPNAGTASHTCDLNVRAEDADPVGREIAWFRLRDRQRGANVQFVVPPRLAFTAGDTPLHVAAYWGRPDVVDLLVSHGADVTRVNHWGQTALHLAVASGHADVAGRLLGAGADPRTKTPGGLTAVDLARQFKDKTLVQRLSRHQGF